MLTFTENRFDAAACQLNVATGPQNGPPLLLLHGATSWWRGWEPVLEPLAAKYHVHAPDLRGSGTSDRTPGRYGVIDMTRDIADYIDALDGPIHIIGHSFGGHVALALSAMRPGRITSLIIEDIPLSLAGARLVARDAGPGFAAWLKILNRNPDTETLLRAVQRTDTKLTPERQRSRVECLSRLDPGVLDVYVNGLPFAGYDPEALFADLTIPTLLIAADPAIDTRMEPGTAARAASLSPQVQQVVIKNAGHNVHGEAPEQFIECAGRFLKAHSIT